MEKKLLNHTGWSILALLRFFLASIVLTGHLYDFTVKSFPFTAYSLLGGRTAVIGFLIISGFSIGYSYQSSTVGYFKRRFLRIYPLYFFAILFTVYVQYQLGSHFIIPNNELVTAGWKTSVANFFFLQGFLSIPIQYNGPVWSLSVEIFLYILAPLFMRVHISIYCVIVCISLIIFNFFKLDYLYGSSTRMFAWAWLIGFMISAKRKLYLSIPFFVIGAVSVWFNKEICTEKLSLLTYMIVSLTLMLILFYQFTLPLKVQAVFNYLGEMSYPLYLFHVPLYLLFYYLGVRNAYFFCLIVFFVTIPINYVLDKWLKKIFWIPLVDLFTQKRKLVLKA